MGRFTCWAANLGLGVGPGGLCPLSLGQAQWGLGEQGAMTILMVKNLACVLLGEWYRIGLKELTDDLERQDWAQRGKGSFLGKNSE